VLPVGVATIAPPALSILSRVTTSPLASDFSTPADPPLVESWFLLDHTAHFAI
jgi:hypothetical protein